MKNKNISSIVKKIIEDVKKNGDLALIKYTIKFDKVENFSLKDIKKAVMPVKIKNRNFIRGLTLAIKNIKKFHIEEYKNLKRMWLTKYSGISSGQKFLPIESVGVYIPGGRYGFNYISTLLMTVIPAQIAGVKKIVVVTPPKNITDYFLYTAYRLGIKEVFSIGGVQAIAALAFGTKTVPKVDMIVGPGNIWVTEAKRQLIGEVGIDLLAGPSEVVVVADSSYSIYEIVYELLAQAEHDSEAKSYFIGLEDELTKKVKNYLLKITPEFSKQIKIIYVDNIKKVCEIINKIAPEHLTLLTKKQKEILKYVKNAGAIFYGEAPSAVFGDYIAGPSHVLPTNSSARFSSGLCVGSFLKKISIVKISKKEIRKLSKNTSILADVEGMLWHKKRVELYEFYRRKTLCKEKLLLEE